MQHSEGERAPANDRHREWFVPKIGPPKFNIFVGLLFLPYTGMTLAYTVFGAALAPLFDVGRAAILIFVYFLALGIAGHGLDALGSGGIKPWSSHFSPRQLWLMAVMALLPAAAIGAYCAMIDAWLLWPLGILEFFFLFAYNLEWFDGRFHTNGWFAFSWGMLPVLAGYVMQTNRLSPAALLAGGAAALFSLVEISASRPYKNIRRSNEPTVGSETTAATYERILKSISLGVILLGLSLFLWRWGIPFLQ